MSPAKRRQGNSVAVVELRPAPGAMIRCVDLSSLGASGGSMMSLRFVREQAN